MQTGISYPSIASLILSTIYLTSSSVTYGPAGKQKPTLNSSSSMPLVYTGETTNTPLPLLETPDFKDLHPAQRACCPPISQYPPGSGRRQVPVSHWHLHKYNKNPSQFTHPPHISFERPEKTTPGRPIGPPGAAKARSHAKWRITLREMGTRCRKIKL